MSPEEKAFRRRLVDQMHSYQKTLAQIQQELSDYLDPEAADLRRFREREPLVQEFLARIEERAASSGVFGGLSDAVSIKAIRDFKVTP